MINSRLLRKIRIFEMLPEAALEELAGVLIEEKYGKEEYIIHRNEPGRCMYFLLSGKVSIRVPDKPDFLMDEGSFFGEMALISGAPRAADVVADTGVRLLILTKQQFETELSARPLFSRLLTQVFAERLGSPTDELSEKNLGKYRIHNEIGRGAMGVIYYGTHLSLGMPVAVKMLSHRFVFDTPSLRRFLNEAQIIAGLRHRNIRSVIDIEQAYGTYFIIMEYIEGIPLDKLSGSRVKLTYPLCREIIYQIADGLAYAHARGVVHRDIKPGNILINDQGEIKITDFGIAYADNAELKNEEGLSPGTPYYAAPEQIRGEPVDQQADIYSFGVMCYNIITGKVPFDGSDPIAVFSGHMNEDYVPPAELVPDLPLDLVVLIKRCLEKDKSRRLHSLRNLRELTQVWAFGEGYAEPMHQVMNELELTGQLQPGELLMRRIRQIKQTKQDAVIVPGAGSKPAAESGSWFFALEPEKEENGALFEFNIELGEKKAGPVPEKNRDENFLRSQLIIREKKRQEQLIIRSLQLLLPGLTTLAAFYKMVTAFCADLLKEQAFCLFVPEPGGQFTAGSYYYKSGQYRLPEDITQGLLSGLPQKQAVFTHEAAGCFITGLQLKTGNTLQGVLLICHETPPGLYSGNDFFRDLCRISTLVKIPDPAAP